MRSLQSELTKTLSSIGSFFYGMDLDEQIQLGHLLLEERVCRVCKQRKNLLNGFYRVRKNMNLLLSYSYECKECTVKRITSRREIDTSNWTYPDW